MSPTHEHVMSLPQGKLTEVKTFHSPQDKYKREGMHYEWKWIEKVLECAWNVMNVDYTERRLHNHLYLIKNKEINMIKMRMFKIHMVEWIRGQHDTMLNHVKDNRRESKVLRVLYSYNWSINEKRRSSLLNVKLNVIECDCALWLEDVSAKLWYWMRQKGWRINKYVVLYTIKYI